MRRLAILGGAVALALVGSIGVGNSATSPYTIRTIGRDTFIRNALIQSTYRFGPERNVVTSGHTVVLKNVTGAPHTFTIVRKANRPSNSGEVFNCQVCRKYPPVNNVGRKGINRIGDSRLVNPGQSVTFHVTARAGKTLYFFCEFHPWMQGKLVVR
ncbi:MAG: Copper binding protein plastocyanin/azurin family [Actinomycetota bacterium]|nr:Copper binding protein plastocyanin/azurin family [Actinomycetota bacterium]